MENTLRSVPCLFFMRVLPGNFVGKDLGSSSATGHRGDQLQRQVVKDAPPRNPAIERTIQYGTLYTLPSTHMLCKTALAVQLSRAS